MPDNIPNEQLTKQEKRRLNLVAAIVIFIAISISSFLFLTKQKPEVDDSEKKALLVKTITLETKAVNVEISAMGRVIPSKHVNLKPQVTGRIMAIHPEFIAGGKIKKDETIIEIDKTGYILDLQKAEAQLLIAQSAFNIEKGQQKYAETEWRVLKKSGSSKNADKDLILRKPQLQEKEANIRVAKTIMEIAELNLERTNLKAPFDAIVKSKMVDAGETVSPNNTIAELVSVDKYWVKVSLPISKLKWLEIGTSEVIITTNSGVKKQGKLLKLFSDLSDNGNLAQILIEVENPLETGEPPILLGEYLSVNITGKTIDDAIPIPRETLREGDKIWLMNDGKLHIEKVTVIWREKEQVFISSKYDGKIAIISNISTPIEEMELKAVK